VAGVDEAGRGPLAGPVVAAAVILRPGAVPSRESRTPRCSRAEIRERLTWTIRRRALCFGIGWADPAEIDTLNILHATFLAMRRAVLAMTCRPDLLLVDGNRLARAAGGQAWVTWASRSARAIVGGDATEPAISAASILAKTAEMRTCDQDACDLSPICLREPQGLWHGAIAPAGEHGPCRCIGARSRR
jgi:ribonuclease HII